MPNMMYAPPNADKKRLEATWRIPFHSSSQVSSLHDKTFATDLLALTPMAERRTTVVVWFQIVLESHLAHAFGRQRWSLSRTTGPNFSPHYKEAFESPVSSSPVPRIPSKFRIVPSNSADLSVEILKEVLARGMRAGQE